MTTMGKIGVLVVPSDTYGVGHFRSVNPHTYLDSLYGDEFDVEIDYNPNWSDLQRFNKYHIVIESKKIGRIPHYRYQS